MIVLGLTGSIGMGKTTASGMLRSMGVPVHDSDAAVHQLLARGGAAVAKVLERFPGVGIPEAGIDRRSLGARIFGNSHERRALEAILHPLVVASQQRFLARHRHRRTQAVALDIPLLFETGADRRVDLVIVVTAPAFIQRQRVLGRGMSEQDFARRLASQMPDSQKRRKADFVVQTGLGRLYTRRQLRSILDHL